MDELFLIAEREMKELRQPYVGTEHIFLAFLKLFGNEFITYETFKKDIIKVIGQSHKESEYTLYTPLLRKIKNESFNIYDVLIKILTNDDSIAYNLLLVGGYDIEKIYLDILSNKNIQDFG